MKYKFSCHQRHQLHPQTLPLLTPQLYRVGWFAKSEMFVQTIPNKSFLQFTIFSIRSKTRYLKYTRFWVPSDVTNQPTDTAIAIYRLYPPRGRCLHKFAMRPIAYNTAESENMNLKTIICF